MILVTISEMNGEHEYEHFYFIEHSYLLDATTAEEDILKDYFGELAKLFEDRNDCWWIDNYRTCWVSRTDNITQEEYKTLKKLKIIP